MENFTFDQLIKIWMHYVVVMCYLNADLAIRIKYNSPHRIRQFNDFISDENEMNSSGLTGHYWRFKNEIKL